jgi:hypothetical protein
MVKTVSFKRLILPAVLPQVSLIVVRGPRLFGALRDRHLDEFIGPEDKLLV